MTKEGLLKSAPYSRIKFTHKGREEAMRIVHNHRLIEYFLKEILKVDESKLHEEAHKLEHAFSDSTIRKLDKFLGNPKLSPDGKPIPHSKK